MKILIEEGTVTSANIGDLRIVKPGVAVVLTGMKGEYTLVTPETPLGFFKARLDSFRNFLRLDVSEKTHKESIEIPGADGKKFQVDIRISARLIDVLGFLNLYGPTSSLLAPFYNGSLRDIRFQLGKYTQIEVQAANQEMDLLKRIGGRRPVYDGVEVIDFSVVVSPDPAQAHQDFVIALDGVANRLGARGLAGIKAMHPEKAPLIDNFYNDLMRYKSGFLTAEDKEFHVLLDQATALKDAGVIEKDQLAEFMRLEEYKNRAKQVSGRALQDRPNDLLRGPDKDTKQ